MNEEAADGDDKDPDHTPADEEIDHRNIRLSISAQNCRHQMRKGNEAEKRTDHARPCDSEGDDLGVGIKRRDKLRRKNIHQHADDNRHENARQHAKTHALFHAAALAGTEIL